MKMLSSALEVFFGENVTHLELFLFVVHEVGKLLAQLHLQAVDLVQKPDFEGGLLEANDANDQFCWLIFRIPHNDGVLLVDGILMAGSSGYLASLVIIEVGVDDDIDGVDDYLARSLAIHRILEVNLLLQVHLALNALIFHIVVNDMVMNVLVAQVELETAVGALILSLELDVAALVEGTGLDACEIFLFCVGQDLDVFVSIA